MGIGKVKTKVKVMVGLKVTVNVKERVHVGGAVGEEDVGSSVLHGGRLAAHDH
jgi:hypothetical protein